MTQVCIIFLPIKFLRNKEIVTNQVILSTSAGLFVKCAISSSEDLLQPSVAVFDDTFWIQVNVIQ